MRGRISRPGVTPDLGPAEAAMVVVEKRLQDDPFDAPTTKELESLGLTSKHLAAAQTAGRLLLLEGVVVLPSAVDAAVRKLASAPQPFTVVEARQAMGASRPVAVALLERLDQLGHTKRLVGGVRLLSAPR
jgi:selenocysteine-specific elongation factor